MVWVDFLYASLVIFAGAVLQTLTGVGTGFLVIPVIALIDLALLPGPMVMASMALSGLMAYRGRTHIDYRNVMPILLGVIPGGVLGAMVLNRVSLDQLGLVFGGVVLVGVLLAALSLHVPLTRWSGMIAGSIAGAMAASTGIGAPVLAILYQNSGAPMIRATLALLYTVASALIIAVLTVFGQFDPERAWSAVLLMPGFVAGYFASQHLTTRLDQGGIRWLVLATAALAGLILIGRSLI